MYHQQKGLGITSITTKSLCKSSVKTALKELDEVGLLVRQSGEFSKTNHLYVGFPSNEIVLRPVDNKADEKMAVIESEI